MLRDLDWSKSAGGIYVRHHWRILFCIAIGVIAATLTWHAAFPHIFWFFKLWCGGATGALIGMIPGVWWQIADPERRPNTSGHFIFVCFFGGGIFAGISIFQLMPQFQSEETMRTRIRSLSAQDIVAIRIRIDDQPPESVQDTQDIASFVRHARNAELFYPSHEGATLDFQLNIELETGLVWKYNGAIRERHRNDLVLDFQAHIVQSHILIPNGRTWLDSVSDQNTNL